MSSARRRGAPALLETSVRESREAAVNPQTKADWAVKAMIDVEREGGAKVCWTFPMLTLTPAEGLSASPVHCGRPDFTRLQECKSSM